MVAPATYAASGASGLPAASSTSPRCMRARQTSALIAANRSTRKSSRRGHGPTGSNTELAPTPSRIAVVFALLFGACMLAADYGAGRPRRSDEMTLRPVVIAQIGRAHV